MKLWDHSSMVEHITFNDAIKVQFLVIPPIWMVSAKIFTGPKIWPK